MGSFNETCALSNLNIQGGTPVRFLFLTQNPYVDSDQRYAHRGCSNNDQWFVRTPPLKGEYDDYGVCILDNSAATNSIEELIAELFTKDIVEQPYGFNQYHTGDVTKNKDFDHYVTAATQGRLLVKDLDYGQAKEREVPDNFPTWKKIHNFLKEKDLPIQADAKKHEGYNAQPIMRGIVCVTYNSYSNVLKKLIVVKDLLSEQYDCKLVNKFKDSEYGHYTCLIVAPKNAWETPTILCDVEHIKYQLETHPELLEGKNERTLPVQAVMIREDVWQVYCNVKQNSKYSWSKIDSVEDQLAKLLKVKPFIDGKIDDFCFREVLQTIPFQTMASTHLATAINKDNFIGKEELYQSCAELARVERVMNYLHHSWYIPCLGGQEGNWSLRTKLFSEITKICKKEFKEEKAMWEEE